MAKYYGVIVSAKSLYEANAKSSRSIGQFC